MEWQVTSGGVVNGIQLYFLVGLECLVRCIPCLMYWVSAGGGGEGAAPGSSTAGGYNDFSIEYAKSNRSTCRGCDNKIDKVSERNIQGFG